MITKGELPEHVRFGAQNKHLITRALKARTGRNSDLVRSFEMQAFNRDIPVSIGEILIAHTFGHYSRRRLGLIRPLGARRALRLAESFAFLRQESPLYDLPAKEAPHLSSASVVQAVQSEGDVNLGQVPPGYEAAFEFD